jgi:hypothetical protein
MATNASDWSNITADDTHVIVDYTAGTDLAALINAYVATDIIWVAKGTYTISTTISLKANQSLFGGFAGTESSLADRAISDLDGNGLVEPWEFTNATEITSSTPVVNSFLFGTNAIIDGITVRDIHNTSSTTGATTVMYIYSGVSGCILRNLTMKNCYVSSSTASPYIINASNGTLQNCLIQNNSIEVTTGGTGTSFGGGLFLSSASTKAIGCVIRGNKSINVTATKAKGGGVFMQTGAKLINCVVYNNESQYYGGGVFCNDVNSEVINCTIAKNKAGGGSGGGVYMNGGGIVYNTIVWGNIYNSTTANDIYSSASSATVNNLAYGIGSGTFTASPLNVKILTSGASADNTTDGSGTFAPKFLNPTSAVGIPTDAGTTTAMTQANFYLTATSPCVDYASNDQLNTLSITTDLMGFSRFINTTADLGAYEGLITPVIAWSQDLTLLKTNGGNVTLTASSNSGLNGTAITYTSGDENVVTINGNMLTIVGTGTTTITASQAANDWYNAATPVIQNVNVTLDQATGFNSNKTNQYTINTAKNGLVISGLSGKSQILLFSPSGMLLYTKNITENTLIIPVEKKGVYLVEVKTDKKSKTLKAIF